MVRPLVNGLLRMCNAECYAIAAVPCRRERSMLLRRNTPAYAWRRLAL